MYTYLHILLIYYNVYLISERTLRNYITEWKVKVTKLHTTILFWNTTYHTKQYFIKTVKTNSNSNVIIWWICFPNVFYVLF